VRVAGILVQYYPRQLTLEESNMGSRTLLGDQELITIVSS
jgi:hypothetical protein